MMHTEHLWMSFVDIAPRPPDLELPCAQLSYSGTVGA